LKNYQLSIVNWQFPKISTGDFKGTQLAVGNQKQTVPLVKLIIDN